ncbi:hypothetical protein Tco_0370684 [Tanacetum coccineum]
MVFVSSCFLILALYEHATLDHDLVKNELFILVLKPGGVAGAVSKTTTAPLAPCGNIVWKLLVLQGGSPAGIHGLFSGSNPWSSLIPLSRGNFDVIVGKDWLSKRKFVIVCHEKVVRISLESDEILRVHGERTQGVVKTLMNTKVVEFRVDLVPGATPVEKSPYCLHFWKCKNCLNNFKSCKTKVSYDLVIFREEHQCCLLRRGAWSSFEVRVGITEEGEVIC